MYLMDVWQGMAMDTLKFHPAMPYPSTPYRWATPETALGPFQELPAHGASGLRPFQGLPAHEAGGLRPSSTPLDIPRRKHMYLQCCKIFISSTVPIVIGSFDVNTQRNFRLPPERLTPI
jgi:hypothetical protein